jgi:hypothetical protein
MSWALQGGDQARVRLQPDADAATVAASGTTTSGGTTTTVTSTSTTMEPASGATGGFYTPGSGVGIIGTSGGTSSHGGCWAAVFTAAGVAGS